MELLVVAIIVGFVVHGLERNKARQAQLGNALTGSSDVQDRDRERTSVELLGRA
jgi:uncharacterized membrane-anchored protein YhcB (DUF1043 family)